MDKRKDKLDYLFSDDDIGRDPRFVSGWWIGPLILLSGIGVVSFLFWLMF